MVRYFKTLEALGERMLPVLARSLDMPAGFFAPFFANEAHINLRFLHYPPQETDDHEQFGQGPHTDNSFITFLAREDMPGLAVRLPSGEWLSPPVIPGTFLVNLGNVMKRWSNDRFLSTPHGVVNDSGRDRYSIAFFYSPNIDATHRVPAELHRRPTTRRATSPRSTATSSRPSTARTTSTRRTTRDDTPRPHPVIEERPGFAGALERWGAWGAFRGPPIYSRAGRPTTSATMRTSAGGADRLRDVGGEAGGEGAVAVFLAGVGGQGHGGDAAAVLALALAHARDEVVPVGAGHPDVADSTSM